MIEPTGLEGRFLIAMPGIGDPRFQRAVILVCAHSDQGAMGLILNQRSEGIDLNQLLKQLNIDPKSDGKSPAIRFGGPVETTRGFVLHSKDYDNDSALDIDGQFLLTGTIDILRDIANGRGPERHFIALGYTGWAPGQLEREIQDNGWLASDPIPDIIFDESDDEKWSAALATLGISPELLSASGGRA